MLIVTFKNRHCECWGTAVDETEVQAYRDRELKEIKALGNLSDEQVTAHIESLTKNLTPEELAAREDKIAESGGDRTAYEFREAADSLWTLAKQAAGVETGMAARET